MAGEELYCIRCEGNERMGVGMRELSLKSHIVVVKDYLMTYRKRHKHKQSWEPVK